LLDDNSTTRRYYASGLTNLHRKFAQSISNIPPPSHDSLLSSTRSKSTNKSNYRVHKDPETSGTEIEEVEKEEGGGGGGGEEEK